MEKYTLKIEFLSDTIFSGGESIVSVSDIDVLYDDYKIPFYKGKSIKGNIREVIDMILENQKLYDEDKSKINEEVAISEDQISFEIVNEDDNILDEIKNLDILSMTPLDAMNALFSLQKKVKNK